VRQLLDTLPETPENLERAELARLSGNEATRERELRDARRLFTDMGATSRASEVAKELDSAAAS